jgi:hypothetical protein
VQCGARRLQGDDPASRYLADLSRRARSAGEVVANVPAPRSGLSPALILALIPLAAGIGVLVGRGDGNSQQQIVDALKAQRAPVVNVTGGAGAGVAAEDTTAAASSGRKRKSREDDAAKSSKGKLSDGAEILATGPAGSARKLEGAKPSDEQLDESREAVKRINETKGKAYVESQRNLPDQIIIP